MHNIDFLNSQLQKKVPWAMSPDTLIKLDYFLSQKKPKVILECGSGLSTVVLANYANKYSDRILISLEHDLKYFNKTSKLLGSLKDKINLICAPLIYNPPIYTIDLSKFPKIDFVLIDGPPESLGGRSAIFDWLYPYLNKNYEVWIDDSHREIEKVAIKKWSKKYNLQVIKTEMKHCITILKEGEYA